jgi:NitT/TauT family transport system substrate-binding protein
MKLVALGLAGAPLISLSGCSQSEPQLRIASNVWPGYELLYLAKAKHYFSEPQIRLVEVPSATVCIKSLAAGTIEGAMLTLDEVLTARAQGLDLKVIAVLDVSLGADVLLARPGIDTVQDLQGKKIGVEQSAVGAVMLDAALQSAGLTPADVETIYMTVNKHVDAYQQKKVDAVVSFEPVKSQLLQQGAKTLFSSAEIPGRVIDVLAVLPSAIDNSPRAVAELVSSHFRAREYFLHNQQTAAMILAKRLQLAPNEVPASYEGLELPDLHANIDYLAGNQPKLQQSIVELARIMQDANLLSKTVSLDNMINGRFLANPS